MKPRRPRRLQLGPIIGHTDEVSTRVWIQVSDDPSRYKLRVEGVGLFDFASTGAGSVEFGTAIAYVTGLMPDVRYKYRVTRGGRFVPGATGTVRTLPPRESMTNLLFCVISCNGAEKEGAWRKFAEFVERSQPSFVVMMGDQVYLDEDEPNVFAKHFDSDPVTRRRAMADMYRFNWSREPVRQVLSNVPTYMMWDDHDIRDGFGSLAADSPIMAAKYPRGAPIYRKSIAYFEDARDVYWHFQGCRNPLPGDYVVPFSSQPDPAYPNYVAGPIPVGQRVGMPYVFRCGRLSVMVLDSRGDRDVFRKEYPILGARQWTFVDEVLTRLPEDVDALAIVTPTPLASQDPDGQTQRLMGGRTDDVDAFKRGDEQELLHAKSRKTFADFAAAVVSANIGRVTGSQPNLGKFQVSNIDEARDQWSHKTSRPEQKSILKKAFAARFANRNSASGRALIFLSGDIHIGCRYDLTALLPNRGSAVSLTSSGISQIDDTQPLVGVFIDEEFSLGHGIRSTLREVVNTFNFGVVQVQPTGSGAEVSAVLAHEGNSFVYGIELKGLF